MDYKNCRAIAKKRRKSMPEGKLKYTWEEFERDCPLLAGKIELRKNDAFVVIRADNPGGTFLAENIGNILGTDRIYYLSYSVHGQGNDFQIKASFPISPGLRNLRVFLFTHIQRTGAIVEKAKQDLSEMGNEVVTIALHYLKGSAAPDISIGEVETDTVYPWEKG